MSSATDADATPLRTNRWVYMAVGSAVSVDSPRTRLVTSLAIRWARCDLHDGLRSRKWHADQGVL